MSSPSPVSPLPPASAPCEVRSEGMVVRYRRVGRGAPVLLLRDDGGDGTWPGLEAALGAVSRLIVPEMAAAGDLRARLRGFLDGLGAAGACVVADPTFCTNAGDLAELAAEQMARLVLITEDDEARGEVAERLARSHPEQPALVLHRRMAPAAALSAILAFVEEGRPAVAG